jgi:integrative and conjugative element protein (TIGR02256 family)
MKTRGRILIDDAPRDLIERVASGALPSETGGILIGYRDGPDVVVTHAVEVVDMNAHERGYVRRRAAAQQRLDTFLARQPSSSILGWVGDFHSHPGPGTASSRDRASIRRAARADGGRLALVVPAWDGNTWSVHGYLGTAWRVRRVEVTPTGGIG